MPAILSVILWAALAAACFFFARRYGVILIILGFFFIFMFGWYLANMLLTVNLFDGVYAIIYRVITASFLAAALIIYFKGKGKR